MDDRCPAFGMNSVIHCFANYYESRAESTDWQWDKMYEGATKIKGERRLKKKTNKSSRRGTITRLAWILRATRWILNGIPLFLCPEGVRQCTRARGDCKGRKGFDYNYHSSSTLKASVKELNVRSLPSKVFDLSWFPSLCHSLHHFDSQIQLRVSNIVNNGKNHILQNDDVSNLKKKK